MRAYEKVVCSLLLLVLQFNSIKTASSPEIDVIQEDLPKELTKYAVSLSNDFRVLAMALDELLPDESYEIETILGKARDLRLDTNWQRVNYRYYESLLGGGSSGPPIGAIDLFRSLEDCLYKCDYASSIQLAANYLAAFVNELYPADDDKVKSTILRMIKLHAKKCVPNYEKQFRDIIDSLKDAGFIKKVDTIFDKELLDSIFMNRKMQETSSVLLSDQLLQRRTELFERTAKLAKGSPEEKYVRAKKGPGDMYSYDVPLEFRSKTVAKHIIDPCRLFVRKFRDIFYPMRLDSVLIMDDDEIASDMAAEGYEKTEEMINYWTKYRLCKEVSNDRVQLADMIAGEVPYKLGLIRAPE